MFFTRFVFFSCGFLLAANCAQAYQSCSSLPKNSSAYYSCESLNQQERYESERRSGALLDAKKRRESELERYESERRSDALLDAKKRRESELERYESERRSGALLDAKKRLESELGREIESLYQEVQAIRAEAEKNTRARNSELQRQEDERRFRDDLKKGGWAMIADSLDSDIGSHYVNPANIRKRGNIVTLRVLVDYKYAKPLENPETFYFRSLKALDELDCADARHRNKLVEFFSEQMGAGDMFQIDSGSPWKNVSAGSTMMKIMNFACGKK